MTLVYRRDETHPMVDALLRTRLPRWSELNRAVDERDDMFDFAVGLFGGDRDVAITNYFQNGLEQFQLVKHIASWRRPLARMLDFASGYGRLTRFLVHEHVAGEITVSDILADGMKFQAEQFGVKAIVSTQQPEDFPAEARYDFIFVASLFTHLPPATFTRWLARLASLLSPDGFLVFSVHDESIAPEKVENGIHFASYSESRVLDAADYGSTWVTESYVRERVSEIGAEWSCVRLPRALSDWQDVYVVSPAKIEPRPRVTPKGFFERCEVVGSEIAFAGWAALPGGAIDRVEIRLDDEVVGTTREFQRREDVVRFLGAEVSAGWECRVPLAAVRSFRYQVLTISAFSDSAHGSAERILFLGTIDGAAAFLAREQARFFTEFAKQREHEAAALREQIAVVDHQRHELQQEIDAMRQSRFWRARDQWFAFKRAVGLTDEK